MRRPELLIPASSLEVLKIAVIYGADAGKFFPKRLLTAIAGTVVH